MNSLQNYIRIHTFYRVIRFRDIRSRIIVQSPEDMAINLTSRKLFCVTRGNISVIDTSENKRVEDVRSERGRSVVQLALNEETNLLYASYGSNKISVYDCATYAKVRDISEGIKRGRGVAVDPLENKVYVVNTGDNSIAVYDGSSGVFSGRVPIQYGSDIAISYLHRLEGKAFLNSDADLLYVVGSISEGTGAPGIGGSTFYLYKINFSSGYLLNTRTLSSLVDGGLIAIDGKEKEMYLSWRTSIVELSSVGNKVKEIRVLKSGFWMM